MGGCERGEVDGCDGFVKGIICCTNSNGKLSRVQRGPSSALWNFIIK